MNILLVDKMVEASAACATLAVGCVVLVLMFSGITMCLKKIVSEKDRFPTQEEIEASVHKAIAAYREEVQRNQTDGNHGCC